MKSYKILECNNLGQISQELYDFLKKRNFLHRPNIQFWNPLSKDDLYSLLKTSRHTFNWLSGLGLRVREGSFTIWNEKIKTGPHVDAPPVVAKINVPVLNTSDTYNVWFDKDMKEIDRVECVYPVVFRSDILHTVELGAGAKLPRIQMSFCFYNEPLNKLTDL